MTNPISRTAKSNVLPPSPALIDDSPASQIQRSASIGNAQDPAAANLQAKKDVVANQPKAFADRLQNLTEVAARYDVKLPSTSHLKELRDKHVISNDAFLNFALTSEDVRKGLKSICKMTAKDVMAIINDDNSQVAKLFNRLEEGFLSLDEQLISLLNNPETRTPELERIQEDFALIRTQLLSVLTRCWDEGVDKGAVIQKLMNQQASQMTGSTKVLEVMEGGVKPILERMEAAATGDKNGVTLSALIHEADQAIKALEDVKENGVKLPGSDDLLLPLQSDVDRLINVLNDSKARLHEQCRAGIAVGIKHAANNFTFSKEMVTSGSDAAKAWLNNSHYGKLVVDFLSACEPALTDQEILDNASLHKRHGFFRFVSSKSELIHNLKATHQKNLDTLNHFKARLENLTDLSSNPKVALMEVLRKLTDGMPELQQGRNPFPGSKNCVNDWNALSDADKMWVQKLLDDVTTKCMMASNGPVRDAELNRLNHLCDIYNGKGASQIRNEDYKALIDGTLDIGTVTLAYAQGLNGAHIDTSVRAADITEAKNLGSGMFNTVKLVTYNSTNPQTGQIETQKRVFKPALTARLSMDVLIAAKKTRYSSTQRIVETNMASNYMASKLGADKIVAKTSFGVVEGTPGILMEQAEGEVVHSVGDNTEIMYKFMSLPLADQVKMRGDAMRQLNQLQWADILSGQMDRHNGNYMVNFDFQKKSVSVTAIDNDICCGHRMVGMRTISLDINEFEDLFSDQDSSGKTTIPGVTFGTDADNKKVVYCNMDQMTPAMRCKVVRHTGAYAMCLPSAIDATLRDKLLAINEEEYRKDLMAILQDEKAVEAAVARLKDAQQYVRDMPADRIINNWDDQEKQEQLLAHQLVRANEQIDVNDPTTNDLKWRMTEFFARDMGALHMIHELHPAQ